MDATGPRLKGGRVFSRVTRGTQNEKGQDRSALFDTIQCEDLNVLSQLSTKPGADLVFRTGVTATAAVGDLGTANGQILTPQIIRVPFGVNTPDVAGNDIVVANGALATPTVVLPANITIIDFWANVTAAEAVNVQLSTAANGAALIGPVLSLAATGAVRAAAGTGVEVVRTTAQNLYIHFAANPTAAAGVFYIMYFAN